MPLQTNYSITQSAILSDIQQQDEDGLLDYVGYGTASAVLSGATGLVNTVIGIGETLGIADSTSYLDEGRVVSTVLGQEGGDFYLRHKEGIDFAGMILSSIVPGAAGVKALRMAQKSGVMFNPLQYSTNLKNADILLDSPIVQRAKQEALMNRSTTLLNPEYMKAVGAGFKQQVLENVAFTAGTVLLNNQNATMNPDDLSYLEAAGSQLVEGLPFIGVGAAVGTAVDALRIGGAVKKFTKAEQNRVVYTTPEGKEVTAGALRNLQTPALQGRNNGDAMIALAAESNARKKVASNITVQDGNGADVIPEEFQYAYNNIMDSRNILNNEFMKVTQQANKAGEDGFNLLKGLFDDLSNAKSDRKNVLAGLETVSNITPKVVKGADPAKILQSKVWDKKALDITSASADTVDGMLDNIAAKDVLAVASRAVAVTDAGTVAKLTARVEKLHPGLLKQVDPKLTKLYGSPLAALSKDAERLLEAGALTDEVAEGIAQFRSTAFVHSVTKEVKNKITPRIADYGKTKLVKSADFKSAQLYSEALGKTFKYDETAYTSATKGNLVGIGGVIPKLQQLDVNFHIAHTIPVDYSKKALNIVGDDLGQLERAYKDSLTNPKAQTALKESRILLNGTTATQGSIVKALVEGKSKLIANLQKNGFNSDEIAVAANVSEKVVLGEEPLNAASMVARTDFSKPEWLQVQYKERTIKDYAKDVNDFTGQSQRDKLYETQKQMAMQELGHAELLEGLPTLRIDAIDELTTLEDRTGLLKRFNADFGTVRETAAYIGKQVNNQVRRIKQDVAEEYTAVLQKFNAPENGVLRAELEVATNFLRTGNVMQIGNKLAYKDDVMRLAKEAGDEADLLDILDALPEGSFMDIGDDVARVMEQWGAGQRNAMRQRTVIAEAYGTNKSFDQDILRAPAIDLRQYRIVAFVRPTGGKAAQDPTKYMLYAQSQEELATKVAAVRRDLGDDYVLVQKGEDAEYFKALQEYEMGHEFRDLFADVSKTNRGRTADILPPLGGDQSRALNDMISSTLRNREYALRASVELQNAESLERLRRYGDYVDSTEKGALVKNFTSRGSHIYTDTVALMLDLPSYKGQGMQLWNEVNTAVAQRGSKVIDFVSAQGTVIGEATRSIGRAVRKLAGKKPEVYQKDMDKEIAAINQMLEEKGFQSPLKDVTDLILQSSDPAVSASMQELSRSMSNLVSLTLLRADPAHSIMQLTSSVILSLPVLRELRQTLPEVAAKMTSVVHPTTGIAEPNIHKMYFKGVAKAFSSNPENVKFREQLKERGIISDYIGQFLDTTDMSGFTGAHSLKQVQEKQSKVVEFISKYSGHTASEEHARFALADAVKDMCVARGIPEKEMWPIISNAVDKVHGNYIASQRPQLFNGVIGQNVGLFQTYFFNVMQHMTRHIATGDKKNLALMGGLQASMFGGQSIPGFNSLNALVANATGEDSDLYSITDANNPNSWSAYGMFGLASQAFGIDFSGRGNLNPRYASIVPTEFSNLATVSTLTGAIGNLYKTAGMVADGNVSLGTALAHGLAHNGMNRPLQGLGTILQGAVTSNTGQVDVANANIDPAGNLAWGSMFSRLIGARPMDEAIVRSHFYRQASYDAAHRDAMANIGASVQSGDVEDWGAVANEYAEAGGDLQQFNAFIIRNMQTASEGKLNKFRQDTEADNALSRAMKRMQLRDSLTPYWED
jgi:hypothetical protein